MRKLYFILLLFYGVQIIAQEERILIFGEIKSDSLALENVHIINKTSRFGTISNKLGNFQIRVKENDTLQFSDIQFETKQIIVRNHHMVTKILQLKLESYTNELDEIILNDLNKTGGVSASTLNLPNADKTPLNKLERNLNRYSQESLPLVILGTLLGQSGGIDNIYNIISGNRKNDKKLKAAIAQDQLNESNQEEVTLIREYFTDDFFTETLQIPKEEINYFITSCIPKNIFFLYRNKRNLEIVDIFLSESKNYKSP